MDELLAVIRFFHIGAGIMWIGLLYYFNFVQAPAFAKMDATARSQAVITLVPQALLYFRYAALLTVLLGLFWIGVNAVEVGDQPTLEAGDYYDSSRFRSIAIGGGLGIVMFLNVWLIIWPNQKKIIAATTETVEKGTPAPPEQPTWARRAFLASRTNVALSVPMLFFMVAAPHLPRLWPGTTFIG